MSKEIRLQAHDILDEHCKNCELKAGWTMGDRALDTHCINNCPIGTRLQELGNKLGDPS